MPSIRVISFSLTRLLLLVNDGLPLCNARASHRADLVTIATWSTWCLSASPLLARCHPKFPALAVCLVHHQRDSHSSIAADPRLHASLWSVPFGIYVMPQTFNFLAAALHPNTLLEISIPESGPSTLEPVVKHLPIKHGEHKAVGNIKRMLKDQNGNVGRVGMIMPEG